MKININNLYQYMILTDGNTRAKPEMVYNPNPAWSNYHKDVILLYKKYSKNDIDELGNPKETMTFKKFIELAITIDGMTYLSYARVNGPVVAFIETDKAAIRIYPQYCLN